MNAVAPGPIDTPMMAEARKVYPEEGVYESVALNRLGTAEEIAAIIAFLLSAESSYVTGSIYAGDGGMTT